MLRMSTQVTIEKLLSRHAGIQGFLDDLNNIGDDVATASRELRNFEDEMDVIVHVANVVLLVLVAVIAVFTFLVFLGTATPKFKGTGLLLLWL